MNQYQTQNQLQTRVGLVHAIDRQYHLAKSTAERGRRIIEQGMDLQLALLFVFQI